MGRCDVKTFEDRRGMFIFAPVPDARGFYVRTSWFVAIAACPACKSEPGVPCRGDRGYCGSIHADRAVAAKDLMWKGGLNTNSNCVNEESHPIIKDDIISESDRESSSESDGPVRSTVDLRGVFGE